MLVKGMWEMSDPSDPSDLSDLSDVLDCALIEWRLISCDFF